MINHNIEHVPVVQDGEVVGILSSFDLSHVEERDPPMDAVLPRIDPPASNPYVQANVESVEGIGDRPVGGVRLA